MGVKFKFDGLIYQGDNIPEGVGVKAKKYPRDRGMVFTREETRTARSFFATRPSYEVRWHILKSHSNPSANPVSL